MTDRMRGTTGSGMGSTGGTGMSGGMGMGTEGAGMQRGTRGEWGGVSVNRERFMDVFATGIRNAHALEKQAIQMIERQLDRLDDYPDMQTRLRQHLAETRQQEERLDTIIEMLGESRSVVKDMALEFMGNMAALFNMPAEDEVLKNTFANAAFENYEIAAYTALVTLAREGGMERERQLLEQSLSEEEDMADWIEDNTASITLRYLSLAAR